MKYSGLIEAIGNTPLIELRGLTPKSGVRIFAKLEGANPTGSLKDRIARFMVEEAERAGTLTRDKIILEPTSGNTGIALAMIGRVKGYRVRVVMPNNVSLERRQLLEIYGAEIVESDGRRGTNGSIELATKLAESPEYFMPYQYGNAMNPRAHYETTGAEIIRDLPDVDIFVAGLGTGGTLMGTGQRLREHNSSVRIVAVEPEQGDLVQGLRSLADGFVPPILDLSMLDRKYLIDSGAAIEGTRALLRTEGIFAGLSSGAVIEGAIRLARGLERGNIVALLADGGWKYMSTGAWTQDPDQTEVQLEDKIWW
ncbi:MAG TPA: cysteine synthase family protein [Chloroflexota bacterium]|nr:cysteine synthase family protein [Chloroflexota bacterium]